MAYKTRMYLNNIRTTITADITAGATSIPIDAATEAELLAGMAGYDYMLLTLVEVTGGIETDWEIVKVIDNAGTLQYTRGQEGTVARAWTAGTLIECRVTGNFDNDLRYKIFARPEIENMVSGNAAATQWFAWYNDAIQLYKITQNTAIGFTYAPLRSDEVYARMVVALKCDTGGPFNLSWDAASAHVLASGESLPATISAGDPPIFLHAECWPDVGVGTGNWFVSIRKFV